MMPSPPEFLCLFTSIDGPVAIEVKVRADGKSQNMPIGKRRTTWVGVQQLFDSVTSAPFRQMTFDDHLYRIDRYEMSAQLDKIIIHASQPPEGK